MTADGKKEVASLLRDVVVSALRTMENVPEDEITKAFDSSVSEAYNELVNALDLLSDRMKNFQFEDDDDSGDEK